MGGMPAHNPLDVYGGMGLPRVFPGTSASTPDTFILPRRQVLWPQLATESSGTWGWSASTSKVFGGVYENSSAASGDYVEFANVPLFGAGASVNLLYTKSSDGGIIKIFWNGSQLGTIDTYNGSTTHNNLATVSLGTVTANRGTLRFISDTKHASSSGYKISIQQAEIIQPTGTNLGTSIDDLPWFGDIPPICYSAASGTPILAQDTTYMWGSHVAPFGGVGAWVEHQAWLPQGSLNLTATVYALSSTDNSCAVSLNGVSQGTLNLSNPTTLANAQRTLSISVPYTGLHTIRFTRGSGQAYFNWLSWRKTAATGAITPTGTTYGVGTRELWPWFAENSDWNVFQLASNRLHYATMYNGSTAINDSQEWTHSLLPGTYGLITVGRGSTDYGNAHWSENGGPDLDVIDHSVTTATAHRFTGSLALLGGTLKRSADSSNGTPANYYLNDTMMRLVRTGD